MDLVLLKILDGLINQERVVKPLNKKDMKKIFSFCGVLVLLFGFFVRYGPKNFPMNGETAKLITSGIVVSTNPYGLLGTEKYLGVENETDYRVVEVISQNDFGYDNRKIADKDKVVLYQWQNNIYPSTQAIDWVQYGRKVQQQTDKVFWACMFISFIALCCYRAKVKLEMIKH